MQRLLLACLVSLSACGSSGVQGKPSAPSATLGKPLRLDLPSERGDRIVVPVKHARATVVSFWSTGCKPCRNWISDLSRRRPDIEAKEGRLVIVAVLGEGETQQDAQATLTNWGVNTSFVLDPGGAAQREAGITAQPGTLIVEKGGTVRWIAPGDATTDDVMGALP